MEIKKLENSELEIAGEIPAEEFMANRAGVLKQLNEETEIDGFRSGHVPENVLIAKVGEEKILMEMAEMALQAAYPKIVTENKIEAIGRPEITITKLANNNPLGFKIKTAVMPEIKLADYKKLAKEVNQKPIEKIGVEDKEVEEVLKELEKNKADLSKIENPKEKIKENLAREKEQRAKDKRRLEMIEAVIEKSELSLPPILIERELDRMLHELKHETERMGLKFDDYLSHIKKTAEDLRTAWRDQAIKRVKTSLLLSKIAEIEKLSPAPEELDQEVKHFISHYKDANELSARQYITQVLTNEKVWELLEKQGAN